MLRFPLRLILAAVLASLALVGVASAAPGAPLANTLGPTSLAVTAGSLNAKLTGTVDPNGFDVTDAHFEIGPANGAAGTYGTTVAAQTPALPIPAIDPVTSAPTGNTKVSSTQITALTIGATYHFRIVATNSQGTTNGPDVAFVAQPGTKPTVATVSATPDPTFTSVSLTGTVNPNGADVTSVRFHLASNAADLGSPLGPTAVNIGALTPALPITGTTPVTVTATYPANATQAKLQPGQTYFYNIVATNSAGSTTSDVASFCACVVVPPPPPTAPTVQTQPATNITASTVTLTGAVNPASQDTTYKFQFGTTVAYGAETATLSAGNGGAAVPVSAALINLTPGTLYHYRVVATNATGTSAGDDATFTTAGAPPPPPPGQTGPPTATTAAATGITTTTGTMNGTVTTGGLATSYAFQWGTSTVYGNSTPSVNAPATTPSVNATFPLTKLKPGVTYHYRVVAGNSNNAVVGADMTFRTVPIIVMQKLKAVPANFRTKSGRKGTHFNFALSSAGKVVITITQPALGGKICTGSGSSRRCVPAPSTGSHRVQTLTIKGKRGKNSVLFTGRPRGTALAIGEYFVTAQASKKDRDYGTIKSKLLKLKIHVVG